MLELWDVKMPICVSAMVLSMKVTDPTACDDEPPEVMFKPTVQLLIEIDS